MKAYLIRSTIGSDDRLSNQPQRRVTFGLSLATAICVAACVVPAVSPAVTFTGLGDLPGGTFSSNANGVSADGKTVVGQSQNSSGGRAFRWTQASGMSGLGVLSGGIHSLANAVSADGNTIVGWSLSSPGTQAFRWTSGSGMVGMGFLPGGSHSRSESISDDGSTIVGWSFSSPGTQAFRWTSGSGMVGLGDFSGGSFSSRAFDVSANGDAIVGFGSKASGSRAFRWTSGSGLASIALGIANGVSSDGATVVGTDYPEAFRWTNSTGVDGLGFLSGFANSEAYAVSADGSVVVGMSYGGPYTGYIWTETLGMISVADFATNQLGLNLSAWTSIGLPRDISDSGRVIVGGGSVSAGSQGWRLEFESLPLLWTNSSSDDWDNATNWTFGLKAGAAGQDDVSIHPTNGLTVTGPVLATTVDSLHIGATSSGVAKLDLQSDFTANDSVTIADRGEINLADQTLDVGTSGLDLQSGGKLSGSGQVTGNVTSNGNLNPGNSAGEIAIDGDLEIAGGSFYLIEIADASGTAGDTVGWDLLSVTGDTLISATLGDEVLLDISTLSGTVAGEADNFDPTQSYSWEVLSSIGGISGFDPLLFTLETSSFQNDLAGGNFALLQQGDSISLQFNPFAPVPEPSTLTLAALGILSLIRRRRKQARRSGPIHGSKKESLNPFLK